MERTKEYTIWLMPTGELYEELAGIILKLSREYNAPVFEPHLTLLGDIKESEEEVIAKAGQLAKLMRPFSVEFTTVDSFDEYFRCVFVKAKETPQLMQANAKARELFGRQKDPAFFPHVSLLYGNFAQETREQIIEGIGKDFPRTFEVQSLHVMHSSKNIPIEDWKRIREFDLGNRWDLT